MYIIHLQFFFIIIFLELRSAIQYAVMIKRRLPGYFWETYIPSLLLSTFGALSVYIPSDIVPGRMVLSMTSFLALIGLFGTARYACFAPKSKPDLPKNLCNLLDLKVFLVFFT